MPMYDVRCANGHEEEQFAWRETDLRPCAVCGSVVEHVWRSCPSVQSDSIPGGMVIENLSATPIRFDSKSEHRRYLKEHGFTSKVEHVGVPGTDKSPHTQRWI